jgi:hypothetical protein
MTTRLELRNAVRRRLEDTGATPLWDDATLNDFLAEAMRRYGTRVPAERVVTVAVSGGATSVPVTPALQATQVIRVLDPDGEVIPRQARSTADGFGTPGQAWRWWGGTLRLAATPVAGNWTVEYLDGRNLPADDVTAVEIAPGDEEIVVLTACATALRRRSVEDAKRGLSRGSDAVSGAADRFDADAERRLTARLRRARGGYVEC